MEPTDLADALIRVPRHHFIPARAWASPASGPGYWIDREADPDTWWTAVYSDSSIYTQLDDGHTELTAENAARTFAPTCSASSPLLVTAFLRHLDPRPGDRVLEIGTGTGWTAGLLSQLAGDPQLVTTVEIDPALAATAAANLRAAGIQPSLLIGDGEAGVPAHAQFDRVHVTCGVRHIPHAWIAQTRTGGTIVLPYAPTARLLHLTVSGDGTASGRFHDQCSFMLLRSQRDLEPHMVDTPPRARPLDTDPTPLLDPEPGLQLLLDTLLGDTPWDDGKGTIVLCDGPSQAIVASGTVTQTGPRDLWDEAEHIHQAWVGRGSPGLERIGLTPTPEGEYVWIDGPDMPVTEMIGSGEGKRRG